MQRQAINTSQIELAMRRDQPPAPAPHPDNPVRGGVWGAMAAEHLAQGASAYSAAPSRGVWGETASPRVDSRGDSIESWREDECRGECLPELSAVTMDACEGNKTYAATTGSGRTGSSSARAAIAPLPFIRPPTPSPATQV